MNNKISIELTDFIYLFRSLHGIFPEETVCTMKILFTKNDVIYKKFKIFQNIILTPTSELDVCLKMFFNFSSEIQSKIIILVCHTLRTINNNKLTTNLAVVLETAEKEYINCENKYLQSSNSLKLLYEYAIKFQKLTNLNGFDFGFEKTEIENRETIVLVITYN